MVTVNEEKVPYTVKKCSLGRNVVISRDKYLNQLIQKKGNDLIKIITVIRRCGKSYLLFELFYKYLNSIDIEDNCIIRISLDDDVNAK